MPVLSEAQERAIVAAWDAAGHLDVGRHAAVERATGVCYRTVSRVLQKHGRHEPRKACTPGMSPVAPAAPGSPAPAPAALDMEAVVRRILAEIQGVAHKPEAIELSPAKFPAHPQTKVVDLGRTYERIAFLSDWHHPFQDDAAIDCALSLLADYRPQLVVLGGDYFDFYSISDHDKEPGRADYLQDEFDLARATHAKVEDAIRGADVVWVDGNHEFRMQRMIARNEGLFKLRSLELPIAAELPKRWMYYPNQTRFKVGALSMLHGDLRNRGTASLHAAKGMLDKLRTCCLFGHLHRFQTFHQTHADGDVRGGFANGHLCDVDQAKYISNPDWQSGITTIEFDWALQIFTVQPHLIVRGAHRWGGRTYGAPTAA